MPNFNYRYFCIIIALTAGCQQQPEPATETEPVQQTDVLTESVTAASDTINVTVIYNTAIYTVDATQPVVDAMAFDSDGTILAIGDSQTLQAEYPNATAHNLAQRGAVYPGFIDAHGHLMNLGFRLLSADLSGTENLTEIIQRLQDKAAELPPGAWLVGGGWDQNDWVEDTADARFPTAADLDTAFPDRPVWLSRVDGHAGWANSNVLKRLDPQRLENDPAGGRIIRDSNGNPTGVFIDAATAIVAEQIPAPNATSLQLALQAALLETNRFGLTGVHEAGTSLAHYRLYEQAISHESFPLRLYAMADGDSEALQWLCENQPVIAPDSHLQMRAVKFYLDGALGSRGAALLDDYSDEPNHRGLLFASEEQFTPLVQRAMSCGLQINTHAIGDRANRVLLNSYSAALQNVQNTPGRHRIEHAQVLHPDDFQAAAELGLIASMQPTHATSDMYWAEDRLGAERVQGAYAWQTFREVKVHLALGSDFPVESANPLLGFYAAISRQDTDKWPADGWYPAQRLTREQALRGFTIDAAYAAFMEDQVGSLEVGKQADFVWLADDIMQINPDAIPETKVLETWLAGNRVFASQ